MTESPQRYFRVPATGETRDCTYPWFFFMLTSRREVMPCCVHPPIAVLEEGAPLADILNGEPMRELRRQLLTGELDSACANCPSQSLTDPSSLQHRVRAELQGAATSRGSSTIRATE
jgi:hypothetical protein